MVSGSITVSESTENKQRRGKQINNRANNSITKHNMAKGGATCDLTRCSVIQAKRNNIRESIPGVRHFRADETEGNVACSV